ncbi:hypothetical protein EYF80_033186 [Liparis tanakae]|uniref:Uncharacterized protein n=1 Tax=Liparis tanakae TaxID=230148 RepID=A0A4Z2GTC9_9TELE|nr:hypothetical protein EYF80_033186 [Liparis tanakae]
MKARWFSRGVLTRGALRNSPIICLLSPFLSRMKRATPTGVSDTKPLSIRYWIPFSGFLQPDATLCFIQEPLRS